MIHDLINRGISLNKEGYEENPDYNEWVDNCISSLSAIFGKNSGEPHEYRRATSILGKISVLRAIKFSIETGIKNPNLSLLSTIVTVNQLQSTNVHNEFSLNIMIGIDNSDLSDKEKEEVKELYKEVSEEVQKQDTNWERVRTLLRRSFDYGLKIAPDIVKLADAYFRAKVGK